VTITSERLSGSTPKALIASVGSRSISRPRERASAASKPVSTRMRRPVSGCTSIQTKNSMGMGAAWSSSMMKLSTRRRFGFAAYLRL